MPDAIKEFDPVFESPEFQEWANATLQRFFERADECNQHQYDDKTRKINRMATTLLGSEGGDSLHSLWQMNDKAPVVSEIECPVLIDALLSRYKTINEQHGLLDMMDYDVLEVIADPVEMPCKIGSEEFENEVLSLLAHGLRLGWSSVSSHMLAKHFKVDVRDFEAWADENPKLQFQKGEQPGVFFYKLSLPDGAYVVGSKDFETKLISLLNDGKIWRSANSLIKAMRVPEMAFLNWIDINPGYVRKISKKHQGTIYYALETRIGQQENEPDKKTTTAAAVKTKKTEKKTIPVPSSITVEEFLALGSLNEAAANLIRIMDHYGNRLAIRHEDAFGYLTRAQKALRHGVALLKTGVKLEDKKLPPLAEL